MAQVLHAFFASGSTLITPFQWKTWIIWLDPLQPRGWEAPLREHPNYLCAIHHILILNPNPSSKHKSVLLSGKKMDPILLKTSTSSSFSASTPCPYSSHTWTPAPEGFCVEQHQNSSENAEIEPALLSHYPWDGWPYLSRISPLALPLSVPNCWLNLFPLLKAFLISQHL